ncbi:MAG: hypothetical protein WC408_02530, partial [Candidatus Micrarchaeia archaeon]
ILFLQLFFFQSLNLNVNSFPSYVTSCGSSWCWEGTYIQHNHVTKTAIYFFEKTTGIYFGSGIDDGAPLYAIVPFADAAAPVTLLFVALLFGLGFAFLVLARDRVDALLSAASAFLFGIASFDGGVFSMCGISAAALLFIYLWRQKKHASGLGQLVIPIALAAFLAFAPNLFFGSFMYYRDWFAGSVLVASLCAFSREQTGRMKVTLLGVLLFSAMFFAGFVYEKQYGADVRIYRTASLAENLPGAPNVFIYGLPLDASPEQVALLMPEVNVTSSAKYGWYYVASVNSISTPNITLVQLTQRMRNAFPQSGYLYADENRNAYQFQQAYIVWKSRPVAISYDGLFSMKVLKTQEYRGYTVLSGIAAASGPNLALEIGSYLRTQSADAIVVTSIV